jgi:pimeloyl-ACP methyl ester carboxylesterase
VDVETHEIEHAPILTCDVRAGNPAVTLRPAGLVAFVAMSTRGADGPAPDEVRALSRLTFDELAGALGGIGAVHLAIAQRAFRAAGPGARGAHATHDAIAGGVYAGLRGAAGALGRAADVALERRGAPERRALSTTPRGAAALAALNGLVGDRLERERSALQEPMTVRVRGRAVAPEPPQLAEAFPDAAPRLVVFVHGLMETEHAWRLGARDGREPYGVRLARDLAITPVYVRYNSGRHVSENGRSLADLLAAVVAAWPVEVEQVALVGHSMGGLVARSACHRGAEEGADWARRVRHVVALGTPHMGAPLEQAVHVASAALSAVPETRPFGAFLRRRSAGIRDMRHGSLVDEDWAGRHPDALRAAAVREVPLLEGATHCFVSATVTHSPRHPVGRLIGDALVLVPSASGRGRTRRLDFRDEDGVHVGGAHHVALLNHPAVYEALRRWLAGSGR